MGLMSRSQNSGSAQVCAPLTHSLITICSMFDFVSCLFCDCKHFSLFVVCSCSVLYVFVYTCFVGLLEIK